jgi:hypothetical protein
MKRHACLILFAVLPLCAPAREQGAEDLKMITRHLGTGSSRAAACDAARSKMSKDEELADNSCDCKDRSQDGRSVFICFVEAASGSAPAPSAIDELSGKVTTEIRNKLREAAQCHPEKDKPCPPPPNRSLGIRG